MSNPDTYDKSSRIIILGTTLIPGLAAVVMIFAPVEVATALGFVDARSAALVFERYGAALFGLAMTGWMVRGALIGGIFGRSYVVGSSAHATVGAFALIRVVMAPGARPAALALCAIYCILALVFGYLVFGATPAS